MTRTIWPWAACVLGLGLVHALPVAAQEITRDPTVAPGETGTAIPSPAGVEGMTVLVRDEKPYLMVGARLYAPGDKVGNLRVERITEKEVWFHDGTALIKVPRFAGIERKAITVASRCSTPPSSVTPEPPKAKSTKPVSKRSSAATEQPPTPQSHRAKMPNREIHAHDTQNRHHDETVRTQLRG